MSSILIKGMDMPKPKNGEKAFYPCMICAHPDGTVNITFNDEIGCIYPLFKVPTPHGRLIGADRLITVLKSTTAISQSNYDLFNHIVGLIEHQPTVIEASA